jgi:hypothetical protein
MDLGPVFGDRVERGFLPAEAVRAEGDTDAVLVFARIKGHLESAVGDRIRRFVDDDEADHAMVPDGQVDEVVLGVSPIFDETERRPLPVDAVPADRVAHTKHRSLRVGAFTLGFALREHRWILIARAQVPHPKLTVDLDY